MTESKLQRRSLKEDIFEILHDRIIAGNYPPGEWLRQEEIATQLEVSMTPVREALDLLVSSGLAERVPYRGVRIIQPNADEVVEAYGLRLLLEPTAASAAAEQADELKVDALACILEHMRPLVTLDDMSAQQRLNREFHRAIVAISANALMEKIYLLVSNAFPDWLLYEAMFRHPELLESSLQAEYQEHCAILEAIADHASERAAHAATSHIINRRKEVVAFLEIPVDLLKQKERQYAAFLVEQNNK